MTWRELPPLATDVAGQLPDFPQISLVAGHIADHREALCAEERPAIARAREKRAWEFATGRHLARCAISDLGEAEGPIPRAEDRRPVWPPGLLGSITHAGDLAVAAVARAGSVRGIGIDLEKAERVTERLFAKLFTAAERQILQESVPTLAGLMFSAKEAAYKAVNPHVGRYIGFQEAEVDVNWQARTLRVRYVGDHPPNRIMSDGMGHFCFFDDYVITVFVIDR
ncbi:MAG: 4'-phosphopantetheinyl transferase superfamily protein [Roseibium album]|uniref:4'-phosphopantetheinyl transferase family protein n=1 Tax=Roseibium album TaxID=311410 RepID=UPI0032F041E6